MGYNSVAVLLNDRLDIMPEDVRMAVLSAASPDADRLELDFRYGRVIAQAHADTSQVVVVRRNSGELVTNAHDLDPWALDQMKACLEQYGYRVYEPKKRLRDSSGRVT